MPAHAERKPIQLTPVPLNGSVAVAPADRLNVAVPLLHVRLLLPLNQSGGCPGPSVPDVKMIDVSVSSKRVAAGCGVEFDTVTTVSADLVVLPAPSRATAVSVCDPSATVVESQLIAYGTATSSAASGAPSTKNCTPTTSTLSDALARIVAMPFTDAPAIGALTATLGGVVSGGAPVTSNASTETK